MEYEKQKQLDQEKENKECLSGFTLVFTLIAICLCIATIIDVVFIDSLEETGCKVYDNSYGISTCCEITDCKCDKCDDGLGKCSVMKKAKKEGSCCNGGCCHPQSDNCNHKEQCKVDCTKCYDPSFKFKYTVGRSCEKGEKTKSCDDDYDCAKSYLKQWAINSTHECFYVEYEIETVVFENEYNKALYIAAIVFGSISVVFFVTYYLCYFKK